MIKPMPSTQSFPSRAFQTHAFETDDRRLYAIKDKVLAQERLSADDALALYRSGDILAVGWLANSVRERMHGDKTYFNVNRHINPTNVCVAACRLCAFGRKKDTPGAYTMALTKPSKRRPPAIAKRLRSSTSSAACIPICHFNIFST